jgi:hypothetical protein
MHPSDNEPTYDTYSLQYEPRPGDTVVFDPNTLTDWEGMTDFDKIKYYGQFYDVQYPEKLIKFVFICNHYQQVGYCVLLGMNGRMYPMCHTSNFRFVEDEEC